MNNSGLDCGLIILIGELSDEDSGSCLIMK